MVPICPESWCTEANEATQTHCWNPVAPAYPIWAYYVHGRQRRCQEDPVSLPSGRLEKTSRLSPHHMAQHRPTGSETTTPYAPWSSRVGSESPSVEDDVDVWCYAILELHARNDDDDCCFWSCISGYICRSIYCVHSLSFPLVTGEFKLDIAAGEFTDSEIIVMLGENGTGKTTFIRMLAGRLEPDGGSECYIITVNQMIFIKDIVTEICSPYHSLCTVCNHQQHLFIADKHLQLFIDCDKILTRQYSQNQ